MATHLKHLFWLLSLASGFILFGIAGILFKIILLPYTLFPKQQTLAKQKQARQLVTASWRYFAHYLRLIGIVEIHFTGKEKLGKTGQLIIANHPSLLDVVFLLGQTPESNCLVKADLLKNPTMNSQIKACGYIPNHENEALLTQLDKVLSEQSLLIFPEGTRTGKDNIIKFHRGAVSIGLHSATEIIPVVIRINSFAFKKGQKWYHIPPKKVIYHFDVGEPIDPQQWLTEKPLPIAARRLNQYLENYFQKRIEQ